MRIRTISLLSIVLISLVMVPHMDAAPGGIVRLVIMDVHVMVGPRQIQR